MAINYRNSLSRYRRYLVVSRQQPLMRASLYVILSLILVIVLLVSALRPTLVTIAGLLGQINQNKTIEKKLDEKIIALQQAAEVLQEIEPRLGVLDEAVPPEAMWGKFGGEIGLAATESGITLKSFVLNPAGAEDGEKLAKWYFTLSGSGSYADAKRFVVEMENMRRVVVVSTFDIIGGKDGEVTLNIAGVIGFLPDNI